MKVTKFIAIAAVIAAAGLVVGACGSTTAAGNTSATTAPPVNDCGSTACSPTASTVPPVTTPPPPTTVPAPTTTTAPPLTQMQIVQQYEDAATQVTASQLANDPSNYNGDTVKFEATISNFLQDSSGDTTAMNVSDPNGDGTVYVQLSSTADVTQMSTGDDVVIFGDGQGSFSGKNSFGGTINESAVTETYLTDNTNGYNDNTDSSPS